MEYTPEFHACLKSEIQELLTLCIALVGGKDCPPEIKKLRGTVQGIPLTLGHTPILGTLGYFSLQWGSDPIDGDVRILYRTERGEVVDTVCFNTERQRERGQIQYWLHEDYPTPPLEAHPDYFLMLREMVCCAEGTWQQEQDCELVRVLAEN